ncbi:hypothetical protein FQZ97_1067990 [compost metagenome]
MVPDHQAVQALVGLAVVPRFTGVHLHAEGALVELRGPQLHQVVQAVLQAQGVQGRVHLAHGIDDFGDDLLVVEGAGGAHGVFLVRGWKGLHLHDEPGSVFVTWPRNFWCWLYLVLQVVGWTTLHRSTIGVRHGRGGGNKKRFPPYGLRSLSAAASRVTSSTKDSARGERSPRRPGPPQPVD